MTLSRKVETKLRQLAIPQVRLFTVRVRLKLRASAALTPIFSIYRIFLPLTRKIEKIFHVKETNAGDTSIFEHKNSPKTPAVCIHLQTTISVAYYCGVFLFLLFEYISSSKL